MNKILALVLVSSMSAMAVETPKDACEPFVKKLCADKKTQFAVSQCLSTKDKELSAACRTQLVEGLKDAHPCSVAILNFCPNAKDLSVNDSINCLTANSQRLPVECQKYLKGRGELIKASTSEFTQACSGQYKKLCPGLEDSNLTQCMHNAYVAKKVEGECKAVMDKYSAMRKKKPVR